MPPPTVHAGRKGTERVLNEMVVSPARGSLAKTQATMGELVEAWFEHARRNFSPKTVRETRGYIDRAR
jgi:integrase